MTTEKIISVLETTRLMFEMSLDDSDCDEDALEAREDNEETIEAINEAIKALKRGDVLDKIRAEIVELRKDYHEWGWAYDDALEIIDNYKAGQGGEGMKLVDVDPLIVKLNEAQIEGTDTYKGLGLAKEMLIRAKGIINPSTDAVSLEEVFEQINCWIRSGEWRYTNATSYLRNRITELPTVIPERPKGEWKTDGHGHIYCTACNQTNVSMWKSDFCPICGSYNGQR